ncbi:MAG: beta-1,6-N-acetylglucosaminyltransferase [Methylovulum sp.]|nr:beta-1,6-N-acetylglucosaminyltransferase [Methylovulum sp.]
MVKLGFILLAHNEPANLLRLISRLVVKDELVVVHWDKKNPLDVQALAKETLAANIQERVLFARRVAVDWGRWSVVEATLAGLEVLESSGEDFNYVVLLSGSDYLIKPINTLKGFLAQHDGKEYIECVDPDVDPWVVQGLVKERFLHHHWFSWRDQRTLFEWTLRTQKKLGLKRKVPDNLQPHFGSQWWVLTWQTLRQVLAMSRRKRIRRFFKTTWVPDELFFQTLVAAIVGKENITGSGLTFYHFTHEGRPLVFYNDHFEFLARQDHFFARKLSPHATELRNQLDAVTDASASTNLAIPAVASKHLDSYQHFIAVQWRGMPGKRVIGRQVDAWYGDLEWNNTPYFVILSYSDADLEPLRNALNAINGLCCYGELFHGGHVDYALPGKAHPFYPEHSPALRDMKRPNFLVDLIQANPDQLVGFVVRLPSGNEMEKIVLFDPQANVVMVSPDEHYLSEDSDKLDWSCAFDNMIMGDHIAEARRTGKNFYHLKAINHVISSDSINHLTGHLSALHSNFFKTGLKLNVI